MTRSISAELTNGRAASWINTDEGAASASASNPARTESWRLTPPGTALRKRPSKRLARRLIKRRIVGMDHHQNVSNARMLGECGDGPRNHRHAADRAILLGPSGFAGCPSSPACRHDERRHAHRLALQAAVNPRIMGLLHCGKTSIARAENPSYCAQLKFMGSSCIKIVHPRSDLPASPSKGYTA